MSPTQRTLAGHPVPSTALLGVLRAMAPPKPAPLLPFLLPVNGAHRRKRDIGTNSTSSKLSTRMRVPEKYRSQPDGSWVPADCWELHGQKWCETSTASCSRCSEPSPILPPDYNDENDPTNAAPTATKPLVSTSPAIDISSLPKGWEPKVPRTRLYPIPVIVTCSIFLAIVIVMTIWLCSISRRRRRVRLHALDIEFRSTIKQIHMEDDDNASEKTQHPNDAGTFAHSTGRLVPTKPRRLRSRGAWYRLRKSRRQLNRQPSTSQHDVLHHRADDDEVPSSPSPHSRPLTPTTRSLSCTEPEQSGEPLTLDLSANSSNPSLACIIEPVCVAPSASPPTYAFHQTASVRSTLDSREDDDSFHVVSRHSNIHDDALLLNLPATQRQHQEGHVATDDKVILARRAQMCSAPSPSLPLHSGVSSGVGISIPIPAAPEWTDDLDFPLAPESEPSDDLAPDPEFPPPDHRHGGRISAYRHPAVESSSSGKTFQDVYSDGRTNRPVHPFPDDDDGLDEDSILRLMTQEEGKIPPPPPWVQRSLHDAYIPSIALPAPPPPHPSIAREHARLRQSHSRDRTSGHEDNVDHQKIEIEEEETFHRALGLSVPYLPLSTPSLSSLSITHSSLHESQSHDPHFSSILSPLPQYLHSPGADPDVESKNGMGGGPSTPPDDSPIAVVRRHSPIPSAPPLEDDDYELASHRHRPSAPPMQEEEYR